MKKLLLSIVFIAVHAAQTCTGQDAQRKHKDITEFAMADCLNLSLARQSVANERFMSCKADNALFARSSLNEVGFVNCEFSNANFDEAELENVVFLYQIQGRDTGHRSRIENSSLEKLSLKTVEFSWTNFHKASFNSAHFDTVDFVACNIHDSTFNDISTNRLWLVQTEINNSSFINAQLAGLQTTQAIITNTSFDKADLTGASFAGATLVNVTFENAVLDKVDFTNTDLKDIDFSKVKSAQGAIFNNTELENVILPMNEEAKRLAQDPTTRQLYWSAQCSMLKNSMAKSTCMAAAEIEAQSEELTGLKQKLQTLEQKFNALIAKNTICENSSSEMTVLLREARDYFRQMETLKSSASALDEKLSRIN